MVSGTQAFKVNISTGSSPADHSLDDGSKHQITVPTECNVKAQ